MTSMQKLSMNVAATLLVVALVILGQAPGGGPAGPDTATATLVSTACASCHTLDRVNNKRADSAAWTATVTRMKGSGADLTDEQVPLVDDYLVRNAGTPAFAALVDGAAKGKGGAKGGAPKGKGGAGGGGKNIQVLQGADLPATMQSFVRALGLLDKGTCAYCHVADRSSDEKPQKVIARRMVIMMRAINGTFPDGKQHVTCFTCHRGNPAPLTEP